MRVIRAWFSVVCVLLAAVPVASATDYYVSGSGSDANAGTSPAQAWRTVNRLNFVAFAAGDRILFEGGGTFDGRLMLDAADVGSPAAPIVVTSYGTGRATIHGGSGTAIQIYNTAGITVTDLSLTGAGVGANTGSGLSAYTDLPRDVKLRHIAVERVSASGFGSRGIEIGGNHGASGFRDVRIAFVTVWGNGRDGIMTYGPAAGTHVNVYVGYSKAFSNPGIDSADSTGNGIVIGGADGAVVERCVAYGNGGGAIGPHGPIGIWSYYSNDVTIQHNESYGNRTGGWADGGGFALDVGVTNSRLQYNYSHGNAGSGFLLAGGPDPADHGGNIVRYNISQNDGRQTAMGSLEIWGKTRDSAVYGNTIFTATDDAGQARAVYITNGYAEGHYAVGVSFRNNIFYTTGGIPSVVITGSALSGAAVRFENNNYYSTGMLRIQWGSTAFGTVASWASATGQESSGGRVLGTSVDPDLVSPGGAWTLDDAARLSTMTAYALRSSSPLIDAGADLGIAGSSVADFYGTAVPQGAGYDIGAHEWTPGAEPEVPEEIVVYARDVTRIAGNWTLVADADAAGGSRLQSADMTPDSRPNPLAAPADYFDVTFEADANVRHRLWLRLRAHGDSKYNDSVYVQFSDALDAAGSAAYRLGTTTGLTVKLATCGTCPPQGWGWASNAYWLSDTGDVWFASAGTHTLRVQIRGDGVAVDQIVLSPARYADAAPGARRGDTVIVPKPDTPVPSNVPPAVELTGPADGATFTAPASVTVGATAADADGTVVRVDFHANGTLIGSDDTAPYDVSWTGVAAGTYTLTAVATDNAGATTTSSPAAIAVSPSQTSSTEEILFYASDVTRIAGNWTLVDDPAAAGGSRLQSADLSAGSRPAPLAAPADFFEVTFQADANTRYRLWLRLRAQDDSKYNDSVYVQFSDSLNAGGEPVYRTGTTAGLTVKLATCATCPPQGWGWTNDAYWLGDTGEVWFAASGTHTMRVQIRGDGVAVDQIVLSPSRYVDAPPGARRGDATIVSKGPAPEAPPEVVVYAADVTRVDGNWALAADSTAAGGSRLQSADLAAESRPEPLAAPADFFEVTFDAEANTRYRLWLRLQAHGDSKFNDSVYVQFSDALNAARAPVYRIGTTGGLTVKLSTCSTCPPQRWGWANDAYWLEDSGDVWFAAAGTHTMRVQIRGDGVAVDQIVLSPSRFVNTPPGARRGDTTIVPKE